MEILVLTHAIAFLSDLILGGWMGHFGRSNFTPKTPLNTVPKSEF